MNKNRAFLLRKEDVNPQWLLIDAEGQVLGRLATKIANLLRGKEKAYYTPHTDCGDYVVVLNAEKFLLSGNKMEDKEYPRYSGFKGGLKITSLKQQLEKDPTKIIEEAVRRMLPKNKLSDKILDKLKIYAGTEHPHKAQNPQPFLVRIRKPSR